MLTISSGNLLRDDADVLVNPVNTVGVMGKGLALQFKRAFPENYSTYRRAFEEERLRPGVVFAVPIDAGRWIVNFPTKRHWRQPSRLSDISAGLDDLVAFLDHTPVRSIAVPPLGCGNGGLKWEDVRKLIAEKLESLEVDVRVYAPGTPAAEDMPTNTPPPELNKARRYLLAGMARYVQQSWDAGIAMTRRMSLVEIHKLAYLMQRDGAPLDLNFDKGHLGPFANRLNQFLASAEGHYIRGYGDGTGGARADLWLLPGGLSVADELTDDAEFDRHWRTISALISGYEYPDGMELLASIGYLCDDLPQNQRNPAMVTKLLTDWNEHKRQTFSAQQATRALSRLLSTGKSTVG